MPIFNPEIEMMDRERLTALQLKRLREMIDYCLQKSPFYRKKLMEAGIASGNDIRELADIGKIPFTTKEELRDLYPDGMLAVPKGEIARIHAASSRVMPMVPSSACASQASTSISCQMAYLFSSEKMWPISLPV